MESLSLTDAARVYSLAKLILARADAGLDTVVSPEDAEFVILGLVLIIEKSEHAPHLLKASAAHA